VIRLRTLTKLFQRHKTLGRQGEDAAVAYLRRAGLKVLERNARLGRYEIDVIAEEGDTIAFVEVKTRRDDRFAAPEENVTHQKRTRLRRAAETYMTRRNDPGVYYRFDVVAVLLPETGDPVINHYRDAFRDE
jgi:putative endonuclease